MQDKGKYIFTSEPDRKIYGISSGLAASSFCAKDPKTMVSDGLVVFYVMNRDGKGSDTDKDNKSFNILLKSAQGDDDTPLFIDPKSHNPG